MTAGRKVYKLAALAYLAMQAGGAARAFASDIDRQDSAATREEDSLWDPVIRIELRSHGRILVPVAVNGTEPRPFVIDTGATATILGAKLAKSIGLASIGTAQVQTFAGRIPLPVGCVDVLQIGRRVFLDFEVLVGDPRRLFNLDRDVDGILGQDVLSRFDFLIDMRRGRMAIEDDFEPLGPIAGSRVHFERKGGKILVPAAGGALRLLLDSGNPYMVLYEDAVLKLGASAAGRGLETTLESSLGRRIVRPSVLQSLTIGGRHFRDIAALLSARPSGRIEDGFLPLSLFDSIYVNNVEDFLILEPLRRKE